MYKVVCFVFIECLLLECLEHLSQKSRCKALGVIFAVRHFAKLDAIL